MPRTEFDEFIQTTGIIDGYTFAKNIELLCKICPEYAELHNKINMMQHKIVDIPQDISRDDILQEVDHYYGCANTFCIGCFYNMICTKFGYTIDDSASNSNLEPVKNAVYKAYSTDYNKFLEYVHEYCNNIFSWDNLNFIQKQSTQKDCSKSINDIPPLPILPF